MRLLRSFGYCFAVFLTVAFCSPLQAGVLYDGSLNTPPGAQGWHYGSNPPFVAVAGETVGGGATPLDSSPVIGESAGYFSQIPPIFPKHSGIGVLDSTAGFALRFTVQINSETHASPDRAGFNVILIDSNSMGVELSFWADEIFAQTDTPLFTHSPTEQATIPTGAMTQYTLAFSGGAYSLSTAGGVLFGGPLKDYSAFDHAAAGLPMDPYETPNFIFLGDDTSRGAASVSISRVELIPEPATALLLIFGSTALVARRKR